MMPNPKLRTQLLVWWILWGAILTGLVIFYVALGRGPVKQIGRAHV